MKDKLQEAAEKYLIPNIYLKAPDEKSTWRDEYNEDVSLFIAGANHQQPIINQLQKDKEELLSALDYGYRYIKTMPESPLRTRLLYNYDRLIQKHQPKN